MTSSSPRSTEAAADPAVAGRISAFLTQRTGTEWDHGTDLFAGGGVSSMFAMELVVFLEDTFDVEIGGRDLRLDNFRTVEVMTRLVGRLRGSEADGHG